ncbi:Conserved oligomeric Golgi complex subunit 4 [Lamellibrachia satsuma]|nr:Conserved oligomeric Golgi complex subunit 4 [Lamellibrachia satsuma]
MQAHRIFSTADPAARVNEELVVLLKQQPDMCCLNSMVPNLQMINNDAAQLSGMISFTSTLAENISSKVRQLDLAKSRVTVCMQRVEDVWDLKYCTDGVQTALQDEDYEKAAAHIHRFLSLDENVLRMSADASEGSTLDTSFKLLHEAQNKLQMIVHRQFDAAVHCGDVASVERFFKIFPLIGQHKEGLAKFSKYLCAQLSDIADKNLKTALSTYASDKRANVIFADTLTLLFEGIARVVEIHQPLVETYYGPGRMFTMMQYLQKECDRQSRKIIDHFRKQRNLELKLQQVQQSLFHRTLPSAEKIDPKELDPLLAEVTLLNARAELYTRFVRRRIMNDLDVATQNEEAKAASVDEVDKLITTCELSRQMQELIGNYIMMEEYFMHEMITKAVSLDITDESSLTSSMVDDAFFIVKKCVRRALSSSSIDGVCAMLNHACSILEQDFQEVFYARLRQGMPSGFDLSQAYNLVQSSLQFGKLQSSDDEAQKQKMTFLTTLNNAEVSGEYIQTLKKNLEDDIAKLYGHVNEQGSAKLQSCLSDLGAVSTRFTDMLEFGFSQFNTGVLKPRLRPWLDAFLSVDHNITEDDFTNYEANDPWVQTFIVNIDNFLVTFKSSLTSGNYDSLIRHLSNEITTRLEKNVMKTTFNRLGGLQFDKELRSLIGYLTSVTTWTIRDRFARLTQMATILNLERVSEMMDYWGPNSGPLTWRLTPAEVRQVLSLRLDFKNEDIKKLKL